MSLTQIICIVCRAGYASAMDREKSAPHEEYAVGARTKSHSTGALTAQARQRQEDVYASHPEYDVIVIGTGMAGLTVGALLARSGRKVCLLEAHDIPGGYVHSFRMGEFQFCAQIHYIWGCGPGERIWRLLRKLGLEDDVTFELLDPEGYDHVILPDHRRVRIPCGYAQLARNIEATLPGEGEKVAAFTGILERLTHEVNELPEHISWKDYVLSGWRFPTLLGYHRKTLQEVFNECELSHKAQAILSANSGNFMCPPKKLSILAYNGLFSGYNQGAYYPRKHFRQLVESLVGSITEQPGCHIYYEQEAVALPLIGDKVSGVVTRDGKVFRAPLVICNADPQKMSYVIGRHNFSSKQLRELSYEYSGSALTMYLGVKGIDLREFGLGRHNTWHLEQWDLNHTWAQALKGDWSKPWMFMATPTLNTPRAGSCPSDCQILELATAADYDYFRHLKERDPRAYRAEKKKVEQRLLDLVEQHHVPRLRQHIVLHVSGSPTTNEDFCWAPRGHAYGQQLTPENMGTGRLGSGTPWSNFHWCNAASGFPGVYGTVGTGVGLYKKLTGDRLWDCDVEQAAWLP